MLKLLAILLFLSSAAWAQSQQTPSATDQGRPPVAHKTTEPTDGHQKQPRADQGESAVSPSVEGTTPTEPLYIESTCQGKANNPECQRGWWQKLWTDPNATFAGFVALFTFALATVGIGQGILTYKQIGLARDEFNAAHRPKVRIKHLWLRNEIWKDEEIVVDLVIANVGEASAKIGLCRITIIVVPKGKDLPAKIDADLKAVFGGFSVPLRIGLTAVCQELKSGRVLTDAESAAILNRKSTLYCIGILEYQDVGQTGIRITSFCRYLDVPASATSYQDVGRFRIRKDADYEYQD